MSPELNLQAKVTTSDAKTATKDFSVGVVDVGETFVSVPDTIPGADDSDQSAALQAFFDAAGDGVNIYVPRTFRFDSAGPTFYNRHDITIFGPGGFTTPTDGYDVTPTPGFTHKWPRARKHLYMEDCERIWVKEITIEGSNQTNLEETGYVGVLEGQHGVDLNGCRDILIGRAEGEATGDVTVRFVRGDFLRVGSSVTDAVRRDCQRVTMRGCDLSYNGRQGFGIVSVEDLLVEDTSIDYVRRTTIDGEPNVDAEKNVRITFRNNTFGVGHGPWIALHRRGTVEDWLFEGNDIQKAVAILGTQDFGSRMRRIRLIGNVSHANVGNPQGAAWRAQGVDGLEAYDNNIQVQAGRQMYLVAHRDCTDVDVHDNTVVDGIGEVKEGW